LIWGVMWISINNDSFDKFVYEREASEELTKRGFDGQVMTYAGEMDIRVNNPNQIKAAALVAYDDRGEPILLSRRFDNGDDIRGQVERCIILQGHSREVRAQKETIRHECHI